MYTKPIIAFVGSTKSGKSTNLNCLFRIPVFKSESLECTALLTELVVDGSRFGVFTVFDASGNPRDYPIEAFVDYQFRETDQKIVMYCERSDLLDHARFVDVPGYDSTVASSQNRIATDFLSAPENYDVLVHVINPGNAVRLDAAAVLPAPRIIVINRIDEEIKWHDEASSPASVIQERVEETRASLIDGLTKSDLMPTVVGGSAIVGLASFCWSETIFQEILDLAKTANMRILSAKNFFGNSDRKALAEAASAALRCSSDDPSYQPSFPAIRFAIGLSIRESIDGSEILRKRLRVSSGVDEVRDAILGVVHTPLVQMRRDRLSDAKGCQTQVDETEEALRQTRLLAQNAKRLTQKHVSAETWASTEDLKFYDDVRRYLAERADILAKQSYNHGQRCERAESEYIRFGTDLVCRRLVEGSDAFSDGEKRVLLALFGGDASLIAEAPAWLETGRTDGSDGVLRQFVCQHAFSKIQQKEKNS